MSFSETATKVTIKNDTSKIESLLGPRLYSDKYSFISEVLQNATDSHRRANNLETPIKTGIKCKNGKYYFYVRDFGTSFENKEEFVRLACTLLESSKDQIKNSDMLQEMGKYGIGKLSPAAYNPKWNYTIYNGDLSFDSKIEYIENKGAFHNENDYYTTDINQKGVLFEIEIEKDKVDLFFSNFLKKVKYFENVLIEVDVDSTLTIKQISLDFIITINEKFKLYRNEIFQFSTLNDSQFMEICLDQYAYRIEWERLGIEPLKIPVSLYFSMDEFEVNPTREVITIDDNYKNKVLKRIEEFKNWIVKDYNSKNPIIEETDIVKYLKYLEDHNYLHKINEDLSVNLKNLSNFSSIEPLLNKNYFKDIPDTKIQLFKKNMDNYAYNSVFKLTKKALSKGSIRRTNSYESFCSLGYVYKAITGKTYLEKKPIFVKNSESISKKFYNYIKNDPKHHYYFYDDSRAFIVNKLHKDLKEKEMCVSHLINMRPEDYMLLAEDSFLKKTKDEDINHFKTLLDSFSNYFIDWKTINIPEDFKEEKIITQVKVTREEVNIRKMSSKDKYDLNFSYSDSKKYYLDELHKIKTLCIYATEDKKDKLLFVEKMGAFNSKNNIETYIIADRYQKRMEKINLKNFIEVDAFINNKHKLFKKLLTGWIIKTELVDLHELVFDQVEFIEKEISEDFGKELKYLLKYLSSYGLHHHLNTYDRDIVLNSIKDVADEFNLYDLECLAVIKKVKKDIERYDFLKFFIPYYNYSRGNEEKEHALKTMRELIRSRKIKMSHYHYNKNI